MMKLFQLSCVVGIISLFVGSVASAALYGTSIDPVGMELNIEERPLAGEVLSADLARERFDEKTGQPKRIVMYTRKFYRDAEGNKVEVTLGNARRYYDAKGRVVRIESSAMDGATRQMRNSVLVIEYDDNGAIKRLEAQMNGEVAQNLPAKMNPQAGGGYSVEIESNPPNGRKVKYTYVFDAKGLLMEHHTQFERGGPRVTKITRNEQGDVATWQWAGSKDQWKCEYEYDAQNNWIKRITSRKDGAADWEVKETESRRIEYLKPGEKLAMAPAGNQPRGGTAPRAEGGGGELKVPDFNTKPEDLYAGPPIDAKKLAGKYHYELGKPADDIHSTADVTLNADSTLSWAATNKALGKTHTLRATGGWMWQNNAVHVVLNKSLEGPPLPPDGMKMQFRLAADGKTLIAPGPSASRFVRQD